MRIGRLFVFAILGTVLLVVAAGVRMATRATSAPSTGSSDSSALTVDDLWPPVPRRPEE